MSRYLLSVVIGIRSKDSAETIPAKIVFVRDKANKKKWIALVSTDAALSEDEIIALYGKRWDIEPFHQVIKSRLRLEKEFQFRSYDAMTAHATIVMARYIFLSLERRENIDWRSVNDGFFILCKELEDISFALAFNIIIESLKLSVNESAHLSKVLVDSIVDRFIACLPCFIKERLGVAMCDG